MEIMYTNTSGKKMGLLNQCRLYLKVLWLSDIVNGDGKKIRRQAVMGIKEYTAHSPFIWPNQDQPSKQAWNCWRSWLATTFRIASGEEIR
jgi:hypothetical protein